MEKRLSLLVLIMAVGVSLVACGKGDSSKTVAGDTGDTSKEAKLVWYYPGTRQADQDVVQTEVSKLVKEKINATVELNVIPYGDYDQKMNIVSASGEAYDMCFTSGWTNKIATNVTKGAFVSLNELVDKYAPNTKKNIPDFILNSAKINGNLYYMPNYQIMYTQWGFVIPKDLIEKYKFDISTVPEAKGIETFKAIEPFLKKIKENEPDLFPFHVSYGPYSTSTEYVTNGHLIIRKNDTDLKILNAFETPEKKESDILSKDWLKKGYIRQDILAVTNDTPDVENQKYAVDVLVLKPGGLAELKQKYKRDFVAIPVEEPYLKFDAATGTATAISINSKNKERAMMLIELLNNDSKIYNTMCFGIEDVHYKKVSENQIQPVENTKYNPNTSWIFGNQFNAYFVPGQDTGIWKETQAKNSEAKRSPLFGFVFNPEPVKQIASQLSAVDKEYSKIVFNDDQKLNSDYISKLDKAGFQDLIAEVQKQVDEWTKNRAK